jgi:hypothetical protein
VPSKWPKAKPPRRLARVLSPSVAGAIPTGRRRPVRAHRRPAGPTRAARAPGPPAEAITPGTADAPRVIQVKATNSLQFTDAEGAQLGQVAVVPGETVTIEVENTAGFDHNFYIGTDEELSVPNAQTDVGIPAWTEGIQTVTWTVPEGDGLRFGCTVPGHYGTMNGDVAFQEAVGVDPTDGEEGDADVPAADVESADATPGPSPASTTEEGADETPAPTAEADGADATPGPSPAPTAEGEA